MEEEEDEIKLKIYNQFVYCVFDFNEQVHISLLFMWSFACFRKKEEIKVISSQLQRDLLL